MVNIKDEDEDSENQSFTSSILGLKQAIIQQLDQGIKLISSISDPILFIKKSNLVPKSTIGKHFRHVLDHFYCLFKGIEEKEVIVDYDLRVREKSLELEPNKMIEAMKELIIKIEHMNLELELDIKIKSIIEPCKSKFIISKSSLVRELWFCTHHAIHHHALIKVLCFEFNIKTDINFGVAPSTLYKRQLSKDDVNANTNSELKYKKIRENKQ
ncbi:hypothetical protein K502DRAFT_288702 [Neoconidiobolus thromboides FSU 785]|nr:hypothetical protein K502DRAFT_288702 [Neoconidiobolus thromboides FSU 785]